MIKARALIDDGKFESALQICNQVLEASPDMLAPQLLKLQISQKQNNRQEIGRLKAIISSRLKKVAP
jgi:predicted negative regulator of RcsB-dependent stress response